MWIHSVEEKCLRVLLTRISDIFHYLFLLIIRVYMFFRWRKHKKSFDNAKGGFKKNKRSTLLLMIFLKKMQKSRNVVLDNFFFLSPTDILKIIQPINKINISSEEQKTKNKGCQENKNYHLGRFLFLCAKFSIHPFSKHQQHAGSCHHNLTSDHRHPSWSDIAYHRRTAQTYPNRFQPSRSKWRSCRGKTWRACCERWNSLLCIIRHGGQWEDSKKRKKSPWQL